MVFRCENGTYNHNDDMEHTGSYAARGCSSAAEMDPERYYWDQSDQRALFGYPLRGMSYRTIPHRE